MKKIAAWLLLTASIAAAVSSKTWRVTTWKDFDEGESDGVLLSSLGEATSGFSATRVDLPVAQVFASATAPDGTVWLGSGDQPDVYAWDGKQAKKVCRLDGSLVSALAASGGGVAYAATLPGGRLWRIEGGKCTELAKLDGADQVWAIALQPQKGRLLAATGPNGKLFAVELPSGKSRVLWESGERHLLALAPAEGSGGGVYVGSADEGILYRVADDGTARAVHDFAGDEVRAIARAGDTLYVAVNEFEHAKGGATPPPPTRPTGTKIVLPATTTAPATAQPPGRDRKGKGAVFRVDSDGRVEQLHALGDGYFTALEVDARGNLFAAAGANGKVYLVRPDRTLLTAFSLPERQVLALALGGAHPCLGTGDSGALYAIDFAPPKEARWISKVFDAGWPSRWGEARFTAAGVVTVETRAGNTARPDKTWSAWQALGDVAQGGTSSDGARSGKVRSPGGRYLQLRATLGRDARLLDVAAWYLPQNQRARVTEVTAGEDPASGVARAARAAGKPRSPIVKIKWKVENPDEDDLVFRLSYRQEGEGNWKPLGGPEPLTVREWEWNTEAVPDGKYLLRVAASDERANPHEDALEHELISTPYLIDNRRPEVTLKVAPPQATGAARDSFSPLSDLSYSVDGGDYQPLAPRDGVLDDLVEEFAVRLPDGLPPGTHSITVRAVDAADNVGLGQATFRIGR